MKLVPIEQLLSFLSCFLVAIINGFFLPGILFVSNAFKQGYLKYCSSCYIHAF